MTSKFLILLAVSSSLFLSCSQANNNGVSTSAGSLSVNDSTKHKTLKKSLIYSVDPETKDTLLTDVDSFNMAGKEVEKLGYEYETEGDETKPAESRWSYKYNDRNLLTEEIVWYDKAKDSIDRRLVSEYDEYGNVTKSYRYDGHNAVPTFTRSYAYKYDSEHRVIEMACYKNDNELVEKTTNRYDEKGHLLEECHYGKTDNFGLIWKAVNQYDADGLIQLSFVYDDKGDVTNKTVYNSKGQKTLYLRKSYDKWLKQTWTYDAKGNLTEDYDEERSNHSIYKYDAGNRLIERQNDFKGDYSGKTVYQYSADGELNSETVYRVDGSVCSFTVYEYY